MRLPALLSLLLLISYSAVAQREKEPVPALTQTSSASATSITVPAGTKVPLRLMHGLNTKNVRVGDGVYASTSFPVALDNKIAIPVGTYVQGVVTEVKRGGHIKGRAELQVHFRTMIFPNGYTVSLPGAIESAPDANVGHVKDKEGKIEAEGQKGEKAATAASTAATGAVIGGLSRGVKGGLIGGGIGGALGLGIASIARGNDVKIEPGSTLEMVIERPITLDEARLSASR
jgi:hypothetical protein